jgi:hypothetical protein
MIKYKGLTITVQVAPTRPGITRGYTASFGSEFLGYSNSYTELTEELAIKQCKIDIDYQEAEGFGCFSPAAIERRSNKL